MGESEKTLRTTSFGSLQVLAKALNEPVVEWLRFDRNGRPHRHERWEHIRILAGTGAVIVGDQRMEVQAGDAVDVPPNTDHWMETDSGMELVLTYGSRLIG